MIVELEGVATIARLRPTRAAILAAAEVLGLSHRDTERYLRGVSGGLGFSDALELSVLDHVMGNATLTANAQNFIALSSTTPTDAGASFTEVSGGSYARVETEGTGANGPAWASATSTAPAYVDNSEVITFPTATADWASAANLTHFGVFAASSGGTGTIFGALTTAKPVLNGDTASFAVGAIRVQLGDPGDTYT